MKNLGSKDPSGANLNIKFEVNLIPLTHAFMVHKFNDLILLAFVMGPTCVYMWVDPTHKTPLTRSLDGDKNKNCFDFNLTLYSCHLSIQIQFERVYILHFYHLVRHFFSTKKEKEMN